VGPETGGDEQTTGQQGRRVLEVNLLGPFLLRPELGRLMLAAGSGSMVNVASVAGLLGVADRSAYQASKHGLIGLTRTLAAEWGGRGVRVNAVCREWVGEDGDGHADQAAGGYTDADIIDRVADGSVRHPDDVAAAVAYLVDSTPSGYCQRPRTFCGRRLVRRRQLGQPAAAPPLTVGLTNRRCPPSSAARGSTRLGQRAVE
jgi:NAD(P)-dependent dehydrogenase (short-subunit alcohol dehydrogenase family)